MDKIDFSRARFCPLAVDSEDRMTRAMKQKHRRLPAGYAGLVALFPLRPLHDEVDYDNALEVAEALVGSVGLSEDQADYLDVLTDIVQKYESRRHAIGGRGTPLETLKRMLTERSLSGSDLGRLLGNRPLGGAILRGERKLSKAHIRILAEHFKVSTDLFID
jgi:HTH-type transcriptional regulator/antitoxin HigA